MHAGTFRNTSLFRNFATFLKDTDRCYRPDQSFSRHINESLYIAQKRYVSERFVYSKQLVK
jgi:hypothetical protein